MTIDYSQAYIIDLSIHFIGNKTNHIDIKISESPVLFDSEMALRLKDFFLNKISKQTEKYQFTHVESLEYNEVFNFVGQALTNDQPFHEVSKKVARHLHDMCEHPNIKAGELFFVHFSNILVDHTPIDAIGIFKTENKNGFFQIQQGYNNFDVLYQEGIDTGKIDKGCLVLDLNFDTGFEIMLIDSTSNKGEEALYWKEDFLNVSPINDSFFQTKSFMNLAKDFVQFQVKKDIGTIEKADQIDMLNKSIQYFKTNNDFNQTSFEKEVFATPQVAESFRDYSAANQYSYGLDLDKGFEISSPAVKKQAKDFKSILKLDKNFHIYIHGDRSLIERGTDENGKKFYKLYFKDEA
ncbi:MAG: nucleoid-associated protein [Chitinophagales bacterium]|nr:nucleoid-associated protein [Chitinophagales bacterium]MCZ2393137.1 nucleoid-associated protein [Chitinophagales bacterium]